MKNRFNRKQALYFGSYMSVVFIIIHVITDNQHTSMHLLGVVVSALFGGTIAGLLSGWFNGMAFKSKYIREATKIDIESGEHILFETPANHWKSVEAVGGKLYLTNKRLIYKSHNLNIQNHELSIDLDEIQVAERYKTFGIINNGLSIHTTQNITEKFVVKEASEWMKQLAQIKGGLAQVAY